MRILQAQGRYHCRDGRIPFVWQASSEGGNLLFFGKSDDRILTCVNNFNQI
jgi:hypothetical protein